MKLSLDALESGEVFTGAPVEKEISFEFDGRESTYTTFVRKLSYAEAVSDIKSIKSAEDVPLQRIVHCICDETGTRVFEHHDVTGVYDDGTPVLKADGTPRGGLPHAMVVALWAAIVEVNALGKTK